MFLFCFLNATQTYRNKSTPTFRKTTLKTETVYFSETLVYSYKSTQRYKPEDQHQHLCRCEDPKSCTGKNIHRAYFYSGWLFNNAVSSSDCSLP
jgi:hypothetical protein